MVDQSVVRTLAAESFGAWAMVRADEAWAQESVPHEPTRELLTQVGLPVQSKMFDLSPEFLTAPLDMLEFHRRAPYPETLTPEFSANCGRFIHLGYIPDLGAFLDPDTGRVYGFVGWDVPYLLSSAVAEFVYFLAYLEKRSRVDGMPLDSLEARTGHEAVTEISTHLAAVDAAAFENPNSAWAGWLGDGFALGLFDDWSWNRASVDYFLRLGVNPTVLEPRRPLGRRVPDPWADASPTGPSTAGGGAVSTHRGPVTAVCDGFDG